VRRDRLTSIWAAFVIFIGMAVLASVPAVIVAVIMSRALTGSSGIVITTSGGMRTSTLILELSVLWTLVFTPIMSLAVLLVPPIRRAVRWNGGLGIRLKTVARGMRVKGNSRLASWLKAFGIGVGTAVIIFLILQGAGLLAGLVAPSGGGARSNKSTQEIIDAVKSGSIWVKILLILLSGVLIPIVEEVVFRGVIARSWAALTHTRRGRIMSFLGSGLLFALAHIMSTDLSFSVATILTILITWILGSILAFYVDRWKTLWPGIFTHVAYNTGSMILAVL
jgi:membrane protease YdiL (CAAX protease family)